MTTARFPAMSMPEPPQYKYHSTHDKAQTNFTVTRYIIKMELVLVHCTGEPIIPEKFSKAKDQFQYKDQLQCFTLLGHVYSLLGFIKPLTRIITETSSASAHRYQRHCKLMSKQSSAPLTLPTVNSFANAMLHHRHTPSLHDLTPLTGNVLFTMPTVLCTNVCRGNTGKMRSSESTQPLLCSALGRINKNVLTHRMAIPECLISSMQPLGVHGICPSTMRPHAN